MTSLSSFSFAVIGTPVPQGSKNAYQRGGKIVLVESAKDLPHWRLQVINAAAEAYETCDLIFSGPLELTVTFWLPKPKKPRWNVPAVKPDLDKLVRAVGDALTQSGVIEDDARFVKLTAMKRYSETLPGAEITIRHANE